MGFYSFYLPILTGVEILLLPGPAGFSSDGLPIGLQIVGRWGDEETVIAASKAFEDARPWADKFPTEFK
ncbi:MAG: hypothetical protein CM1200mP39_24420 [Dehalococcoidia bacterium]|nr:MAG: hypothetical protein CM1200mP39_24420 [Dehalococcoidia bacterium]